MAKVSAADAFQVRSVSQQRFVRQLGTLSETIIKNLGLKPRPLRTALLEW
ncbi:MULTISPECIES: hypothetical protein [unclassified Microcoleus]